MSTFKCKMCGGEIEFEQGATVGVCDSCGTKQTLPRLDDDRKANLYDRANHFRRNNDFDKAMGIYEQILNEDGTDAETYWSLVLCRYGIEYVEDPATHKRVPTVNRAQYTSIFDDDDYKSALKYADSYQRSIYEEEAKAINEIQKGILEISQKEEPFDVFICYKETDSSGRRTPDSVLANDLYHQLTQEGFKVFFSGITLEDKLGTAYEPYIFAALNSAKVMVVIGTKPEYFNAVWVKNEWSRYLALVKKSGGKKVLIPAYRDMDPYDLPEEFSHLLAQDMSKLGFMQDLIRGIKKIASVDEPKAAVKETVVVNSGSSSVEPLLKRAFMFLEDREWEEADKYCEKVLDIDPENAQAYLGKLMAECEARRKEDLKDCRESFDDSRNFEKVVRFGDKQLVDELEGYSDHIYERNELNRKTKIYNEATANMNSATTEEKFKAAAKKFESIHGFKDADERHRQCLEKAEENRIDFADVRSKFNDPNCSVNLILVSEGTAALCGDDYVKVFGWNPGSAFKRENVKAVASNFFYIAELCTNGTVVVGEKDHSFKVADWQGITAINARDGLTGLRADGTAVAYKLFGSKKCDIDQWSDVAYAVYHTVEGVFGVCKNGDVIYNGKYGDRWRYVTEAKNVARIKILDYSSTPIVVFYADGSAELINSGDKQAEAKWSDAVDVVSGSYGTLLILQSDGNAFTYKLRGTTAGPNMKINWTDIVSICDTHSNYFVGLKSDGTVKAEYMGDDEFHKYKGQCDVSDWRNIIAVYSRHYLTVGIRADGSVVYCGEAEFTKSNPDWNLGWKLFDGVKDLEENIKRNKEFKASMERAAEEQREERKRAEEERKRATEEARLARIAELEKEKQALQAEIPTIKGLFAAGKIKKLQARVDEIETELTKLK